MGAAVSALNNVGYSTQKNVVIKSWSLSACCPRFRVPSPRHPESRNAQHPKKPQRLHPLSVPPLTTQTRPPPRHAGLLYYSIIAVMFAYVVGFTLVAKKGYQATVPAVGSVALKVKGIASRPSPPGSIEPPELWDASDLTVYDSTGVFVATNIMRTEQARGVCPGTHEDEACALPGSGHETEASPATECREGVFSRSGEQTGRCVPAPSAGAANFATRRRGACEVRGWCPGEPDADDASAPLENVGNFTVFLRTDVRFPGMRDKFGRTFDVTNANGTEPTPGWNLFTLDEILRMGGVRYEDVKDAGADVQMNIYYDCDLDSALEACTPRMPFEVMRIDTADSALSHGYNARWLSAAKQAGGPAFPKHADTRALVKASGPRIRVSITGVGRRFDLGQLTTVVGAGVALMGIATAVVDVLLLYVLPKRARYFGLKYQVYGANDEDLVCGAEEAPRGTREEGEEPLLRGA